MVKKTKEKLHTEDRADWTEIRTAKREIAREGTVPWEQIKKELNQLPMPIRKSK